MSGVRAGTRLEHLEALARRVQHEIDIERGYSTPRPIDLPRRHADDPWVLVPLSHVARAVIRAWSGGDPSRRGTLPNSTVRAYAAAHHPTNPTGARSA